MKPNEFLFEAEQNIKKAKANQYLGQLSDADLAMVASLLQGSLEEGVQDLMTQKKAGKRIDGRPSDFVAYDDINQTAKRYLETNNGLQVTDARYSPPPRGYTPPTQTALGPTPQPEVKSFVASLDNEEKEALLNVVKKEAKKRKAEPKKAEPKKSSSGKVVAGVLAGLLALGIYATSTDSSTDTNSTPDTVQIKPAEVKKSNWEQSSGTFGINDTKINFYSVTSKNKINLDFPYGETYMKLAVRYTDGKLSNKGGVYLESKGQFHGDDSDVYGGYIKVKFDNGPVKTYRYLDPADNSTGLAFIQEDADFVKNLKNSKKVKIQMGYYQNGNQVFEFDTEGLDELLVKGKK